MTTHDIDPTWFEPDNFDPCEGCATAMLQLTEVIRSLAERFKAHEAKCDCKPTEWTDHALPIEFWGSAS